MSIPGKQHAGRLPGVRGKGGASLGQPSRAALLATHTGEEPLSYEHGFPLRLVAPGRRGFEWVKWITRVEVLTEPDPGEVFSIFTSSFTDAGRGR